MEQPADPGLSRGGGGHHESRRRELSWGEGSEGIVCEKFLKISVSKMAISSIFRQFSYFKLRFCKKENFQKEVGPLPPPHPPLDLSLLQIAFQECRAKIY